MNVIYIAILGIVLLVVLITVCKLHTFLAFIIAAVITGLFLGLPVDQLSKAIQTGIGSTLSSIITIVALGAMLGKLVALSGAAETISNCMVKLFGIKNIRWAFLATGFIVGLPLFYSVGFMLLAPLVITVAVKHKVSAIYAGLPMLASLSVTQGFLPPHPAPLYLVQQLHADMGKTLLYGIIIAVPSILVSGAWFGRSVQAIHTTPNLSFVAPVIAKDKLPTAFLSFFAVLLPVLLIGMSTVVLACISDQHPLYSFFKFLEDATNALLIAVLFGIFTLGINAERNISKVTTELVASVKEVAALFLIFAGAGALKQILTDGGVSQTIAGTMQGLSVNPYVSGWAVAAIIRVAVGSSTVAGITTAAFILPLMSSPGVDPNLMVLSIGAGSMMFSHVNDTGFWLFREYFQLSLKDTIRSWSIMDTLIAVVGLAGVLVLSKLI